MKSKTLTALWSYDLVALYNYVYYYYYYYHNFLSPPAQSRRQENYARHTKLWLQRQLSLSSLLLTFIVWTLYQQLCRLYNTGTVITTAINGLASKHRWTDELSMSVQRCYKTVSNNQPAYKTRHEKIAKINRINVQKRQTSLKLSWNWTSLWHCINRQNTPTKQCNEKITIHCIHREYLTIKTMSSLNYHASGRKRQRRQEKNTSKLYRTK